MTVGIPGAGIGGLFYLASALWMPVREVGAILRGKSTPDRRRLVLRQTILTVLILAAMGGVGMGMETLLEALNIRFNGQPPRILTVSAFWVGLGTLTTVYASMHLARIVAGKRATKL